MKRAWKVIHLVGDDDPIDVVSDDEAVGHVLNDNTIDLTGDNNAKSGEQTERPKKKIRCSSLSPRSHPQEPWVYSSNGRIPIEILETVEERHHAAPVLEQLEDTVDLTTEPSDNEELLVDPRSYTENSTTDGPVIDVNEELQRRRSSMHNKFGQKHLKLVVYPENLDCLIEKFRRKRKLKDIEKGMTDYSDPSWIRVPHHIENGIRIFAGEDSDFQLKDGTLLRVKKMAKNIDTGCVMLRGWKFHPTADLQPALPPTKNEVFLLMEVDKNSERDRWQDAMVDVPACDVLRERVIKFTNEPNLESRPESHSMSESRTIRCRWKLVITYRDVLDTYERLPVEFAIEAITNAECDNGYSVADADLRCLWRGSPRSDKGRYTFCDGFCGAGGTSSGARLAGLDIARAFDINTEACASFRRNFPAAVVFNKSVEEYCQMLDLEPVDVSHYSVVCKTYSPSHTTRGKHDESNEATSYCIEDLLMIDRPRVTTFENTGGLLSHHADLLYPILGQYTSKGFSIKFRLLNLSDWGLPQSRQRLVLIGSCPGEPLPDFPKPTHSSAFCDIINETGLKPYVGFWEAIKPLEVAVKANVELPNHDPWACRKIGKRPFANFDQAKCVTCDGGGNYHPSGERELTIREFAVIQGFPIDHQFDRASSRNTHKTQVGNAFPGLFTRHLYRTVIEQLREADGHADPDLGSNPLEKMINGRNGSSLYVEETSPLTIIPVPASPSQDALNATIPPPWEENGIQDTIGDDFSYARMVESFMVD